MEFVQSHYRSNWIGVIIDRLHRVGCEDLLLIVIVRDSGNRVPNRRITKLLSASWVTKVLPIEICEIHKSWFDKNNISPMQLYSMQKRM
jgi:hypothetical protein